MRNEIPCMESHLHRSYTNIGKANQESKHKKTQLRKAVLFLQHIRNY
jgi:hypothetical protein